MLPHRLFFGNHEEEEFGEEKREADRIKRRRTRDARMEVGKKHENESKRTADMRPFCVQLGVSVIKSATFWPSN